MSTTTATITNNGLNLLADAMMAVSGAAASPAITYVAVGTGIGLLNSALTNGTSYTTLTLQATSPVAVANGSSLTIVNGATTQVVTLSSAINIGDITVNVTSFMASANFGIGSGLLSTPIATDAQLNNEVLRKAVATITAGASPGEALFSMYIAPTDGSPPVTYLEVGYFAGNATSTLASGTLLARAIYWYQHTSGDSGTAQLDITI